MLTRRVVLAAGAVSAAMTPTPVLARGVAWPKGARAAVSLTYDDGLDSQLDNVAPVLDAFGFKATFFLTEENMEERLDDWAALSRQGHEIADHTIDHPCALDGYTSERFSKDEVEPMERFLSENFASEPNRIFGYPCGVLGLGKGTDEETRKRYIEALKPRFVAARTAGGPPNDPRQVSSQRYGLQAWAATYAKDDPLLAIDYVRGAMRQGFWAILIFHDVLPQRIAEGDTSIASHNLILDWINAQPVWCAPMGSVMHHLRQVHSAKG
jgi:hypothetical protein